jgi:hypothetical protein
MAVRKIRQLSAAAATLFVAIGLLFAEAGSPPSETFDGAPSAPQPFSDIHWDVQYHQRDNYAWQSPIPVNAHHGPNCEAPDTTHQASSFESLVFKCNNHVMTAIDGGEYGMIYLTPDHILNWGSGTATVEWDMSTFRSSNRDWIDLWITPYGENLALPLDNDIPDAQGTPRNAIHIRMDGSGNDGPLDGGFKIFVYQNGSQVSSGSTNSTWNPYNDFLTTDKARRDTFRLEISRSRIELSMPGYGETLQLATGLNIPFNSGIVQFGHHSYNPRKDGGVPNTWHWDNIRLSPSTPFSMIPGDRLTVDGSSPQTVRFQRPAPSNSYLRFAAQGRVEYSVNGGSNWQTASKQWASQPQAYTFGSYFVPIPAGTQEVTFRLSADGSLSPPYQAKGFAIWSSNTSSAPPAAATNTPTRTPTTAATATRTATPRPTLAANTPRPTQQATNTPRPPQQATNTPRPTQQATNTPTRPTATPTAIVPRPGTGGGTGTATLRGNVSLEGRWSASGTTVTAMPGGRSTKVGQNGTFTLSGLNPNTSYTLTASNPGYLSAVRTVRSGTASLNLPFVRLKAGDVTGDGRIDLSDVSMISNRWGQSPGTAPLDFNLDGKVDISDISLLVRNYGLVGPGSW